MYFYGLPCPVYSTDQIQAQTVFLLYKKVSEYTV